MAPERIMPFRFATLSRLDIERWEKYPSSLASAGPMDMKSVNLARREKDDIDIIFLLPVKARLSPPTIGCGNPGRWTLSSVR
jgi:hypothetical protein